MDDKFDEHVEIRKCTISPEESDSILSIKLPESKLNFGEDHNLIPLIFYIRVIKPEVENSPSDDAQNDSYKISIEVSPTDKSNKPADKPTKKHKKGFLGKTKPGGCMKPKTVGSDLSLNKGPKIVYIKFRLVTDAGDEQQQQSESEMEEIPLKITCPAKVEVCETSCMSPCKASNCCTTSFENKCKKSCTGDCSRNLKKCLSLDSAMSSYTETSNTEVSNTETDTDTITNVNREQSLQKHPTYSKLNVEHSISTISSLTLMDRDPSLVSSDSSDAGDLSHLSEIYTGQVPEPESNVQIKIVKDDHILIIEQTQNTQDLHAWYRNMFQNEMDDYYSELEKTKNEILEKDTNITADDKNLDEIYTVKNTEGMELGLQILEDNVQIRVTRQ